MYVAVIEAIADLRVNLSKNVPIPIGEVPHLVHLAGCRVEHLPSSYLGFRLVLLLNVKYVGNNCGRVPQETSWQRSISREGRLTLPQSTLWRLPIYFVSLFTIQLALPPN